MPNTPGPSLSPDNRLQAVGNPIDPSQFDPTAIGLCLSGGGYKAAAYHLGAIIRLNELGLLGRINRIASVSGGSITAGHLGRTWARLTWDPQGRAENLHQIFVAPLKSFLTSVNIDVPAALQGLFIPGYSGADAVQAAYAKHLFGDDTLQVLPDGPNAPRFVILATNYQLNSLWRFSSTYAADYRVGMILKPDFPLARVVAASSGFPPFFSPVNFDLSKHNVMPLEGADLHHPPYTQRAQLADGGIYDNMGLEPIWKRCGVLLVSNAGDPFDETPTPPTNWLSLLRRTLSMVHRQAENNRVRWLVEMARSGDRKLAYWPLRNTVADYPARDTVGLPAADARAAMSEPVRLWSLKSAAFTRLVRHGYSICDAAVRSFIPVSVTAKPKLPEI